MKKQFRNVAYDTLIWAHMGAFALTDAALMNERRAHDMPD